jgi:hypothetical protein
MIGEIASFRDERCRYRQISCWLVLIGHYRQISCWLVLLGHYATVIYNMNDTDCSHQTKYEMKKIQETEKSVSMLALPVDCCAST